LRRAAETEREQSKKSSFFTRERAHVFSLEKAHTKEKSKRRLGNTRQTLTEEKFCFVQKNVFILVVFTNIKQSSLCSSSALCAETLFRLHSLRSLSLHFEEAFVVVVVSEEARFCLRSLFLVV
jgi:hypothetical protein